MLPREIISDLEKKLKAIEDHPEFSGKVRQEQLRFMTTEANFHSFMMEVSKGTSSFSDAEVIRRFGSVDDIRSQTQEVWQWALENYEGFVSHDLVKGIAARFEPKLNWDGYRRDNVRLNGLNYTPPRWEKVANHMCHVLDNASSLEHPIERALYAHFHIARVQPFIDGNKRTSRLVQNVVLNSANFPPIVIYGGDKDVYLDHFEAACLGYKNREDGEAWEVVSNSERLFYRYLVGKLASSLDQLYSHLINRRNYIVTVNYREKGCMFTLKRVLNGYFAKSQKQGQARIKNNLIDVRGDIGRDKLTELLECTNGYKKCEIEVVR